MAVPASVVVASCLCVGASACVSSGLAFCATFAVSLPFVARELSPEHIDGVFAAVDACLQKGACYARAAVEAETRRLRDPARCHPALAFLYARAEGGARRARALVTDAVDRLETRAAESKWRDMTDASAAALRWLRLIAGAINLAVAVLITMSERRAASGLRRSGAHGIRTTPNSEAMTTSSSKLDATLFVVWITATFTYSTPVFFQCAVTSGMASLAACFACFATMCCFALMQANKVHLWSSRDAAGRNAVMAEVEAIGSAGVIRRRGHAVAVCAMGIAKVFVVCFVLDFRLGALRFAFLCSVIAFLLNKAAGSLPDVSTPVDASAGDADVAGDVELLPEYVSNSEELSNHATFNHKVEEDSSSPAAGDRENEHDSSNSATIDGGEDDTTTKEYFDGSDSEEQRQEEEEEDYGGGMDEWNLVEIDPVMPINVNGGAKRW
ncbi:hypothetical protein OsJ_15468 [Oryza sativa Japonica Group]|uniref:Uncharacterized protein n=1 Tax=Oryza sativa subsp. japonica TaxID=39947 RepID=A3AVK7_ORYSJ|nr:hypothetical protein OsJ_15468 [Oryza sativa Japonica Group]